MIPRMIHYCWFGNNPKPDLIEKCISSWRKYCPDWEIIEWNENNWDIKRFRYAHEAYEAGKWAFVSDVARLDVLFELGGVYLDTDVEILSKNPFEQYIDKKAVLCFENARGINTGQFFAVEKGSELCRQLLKTYEISHYSKDTQKVNTAMDKPTFKSMLPGLKWNGQTQQISDTFIIGCEEYSRLMKHHGTRSWCDYLPASKISKGNMVKCFLRNPKYFEKMEGSTVGRKILPLYTFLSYDLLDLGPIYFLKLFFHNHIYLRFKNK